MRTIYSPEDDHLRLVTQIPSTVSASLLGDPGIALDLSTEDGHELVGVEILGISAYVPLGKNGYDADTDTLTMGKTTTDPELIAQNGDLIGYWHADKHEPGGYRDPIGVAIRRASVHLAKASEKVSANLVSAD